MLISQPQVRFFLQILDHSSVSWKITTLYLLRSKFIYFAQKKLIEEQLFENFEYLDQNSKNYCLFRNNKLIFLRILHNSSVSWDITPLYLLVLPLHFFSFKYDMRNLINFHPTTPKSLKFYFDGHYCPKHIML